MILQELSDLGYDVKSLDAIIGEYRKHINALNQLKDKVESLSAEYRNLCKLEDGIMTAKEHSYYEEIMNDQSLDNKQTMTQDESIHISSESLDSYIEH